MSKSSLLKFHFLYLIILMYNIIMVQSNEYVEFINENGTDILFDLKDEMILKEDRQQTMADGSGEPPTETSIYIITSITLISTETSSIPSTAITKIVTNADDTSNSEGSSTITITLVSFTSTIDHLTPTLTDDTTLKIDATDETSSAVTVSSVTLTHIVMSTDFETNTILTSLVSIESSEKSSIGSILPSTNTFIEETVVSSDTSLSQTTSLFQTTLQPTTTTMNGEETSRNIEMSSEITSNSQQTTPSTSQITSTLNPGTSLIITEMDTGASLVISEHSTISTTPVSMSSTTTTHIDTSSRISSSTPTANTIEQSTPSKSVSLTTVGEASSSIKDSSTILYNSSSTLVSATREEKTSLKTMFTFPMETSLRTGTIITSNSATPINFSSNSTTIITPTSSMTTTPRTLITTDPYNPDTCNSTIEVKLPNGICVSKVAGQINALNTLNTSANATEKAKALVLYFSSTTNASISSNTTNILPLNQVDTYLANLTNINLDISSNSSFIIVRQPNLAGYSTVFGASFTRDIGDEVIDARNAANIIYSNISAAAIVSNESLSDVTSLNMLIIKNPVAYTNIDNSDNKTLISSIIVVNVQRNNKSSNLMKIFLYFENVLKPELDVNENYVCSFYDTNTAKWNDSGCTKPRYNTQFYRYECSCDHTTSFALIWLPQSLFTNSARMLDAQDIASLVFQSISILCFLVIIIHGLSIRICDPFASIQARHLLPLISCAVTMLLFIFFIALGMTVFTTTSSPDQTECFLTSTVLMFFTYFFLIFMFCVKTSVGYFNYLRFIHLFPEPSPRKLCRMLLISFFISITWTAFAAGFNSNSSFQITQLYPYKLCWFTRHVIYYFLTIPACLFISINIIIFIRVALRIIDHAQNATSPHQSYQRMKQCVLVLLSSCVTQGIGWLFGPFISFINPTAGNVLGWFFIIFNGLEGLWSIILYIIIRSEHMDEQKRVTAYKELTKSTAISSVKSKKDSNRSLTRRFPITNENSRKESHDFHDLNDIKTAGYMASEC